MPRNTSTFICLIAWFLLVGCSHESDSKTVTLTKNEKNICDSLRIDTTIVRDIKVLNSSRIEPFHYSLSKVVTKDSIIESEPIFLNGLVFKEQNTKSYDIVFSLKDKFRSKGYSIFLLENNFALSNQLDYIGVLKTTDKFSILRQIATDGINYGITNDSLITIIKNFDKKYSLDLIGASGDWCEFTINKEPINWLQLANEVYKICPDVVDQNNVSIQALADEMSKTKRLYFWWD